jgi:hypothetical protein
VAEAAPTDDLVVVLGSPSASARLRTTVRGATLLVALAGIPLGLPIYVLRRDEGAVRRRNLDEQVSIMESVLEMDAIIEAVRGVRESFADQTVS